MGWMRNIGRFGKLSGPEGIPSWRCRTRRRAIDFVLYGVGATEDFQRDGQHLLRVQPLADPLTWPDMARTTGHVTIVTGGQWHPHEKMQCLTSGMDGSLRIWDHGGKTGLRDFLLCDHTIRVRDKGREKSPPRRVATRRTEEKSRLAARRLRANLAAQRPRP